MHGFPLRRLALTGTLAICTLAAMAGSAHATVTASAITSPAANSYFFYDANGDPSTLFTVTGTTTDSGTGSANVDIDCDDGAAVVGVLATDVTVLNNAFSVPISTSTFASKLGSDTCVLRAVPTGVATGYPPGSSTVFSGPVIAVSAKHADTSAGGVIYDYSYDVSDFGGYLQFTSPGDCGLQYGALYASGSLAPSAYSFRCLGGLFDPDVEEDGSNYGGGIQVDGVEALDSAAAYGYKSNDGAFPGYQGITLSESFNGGALTIDDDEPILDCVPNYASCTSFKPSGVELDRTWESTDGGEVALQTDLFRSVDGAQHSIAVLEDDTINNVTPPGSAFAFPGSSGFQDYAENATVPLPSGSGTIEFKTDSSTPAGGDGTDPQGGITYASAPNGGPVDFSWSDETSAHSEFVLHYTRTIPAGGSVALRFGYEQDYALSDVQTLAQSVLTSFAPAVTITSPGNGATVSASPVTVSGTASDPAGVTSVKIDGTTATLGAGNTFTAPVSLTPGVNTITAIATDTDGFTGQQQLSVTYHDPPSVTTGKASHITGASAKIAGTVNPESQATTYEVQYGTKPTYASHTKTVSAGASGALVAITTTLKGLKAKTTYYYRLDATNASGTSYGTGLSFRTGKPSPKGLGAKASPKTAKAFPYLYIVKGKLSRPTGITAKRGCRGKITIKVKRGKKTIYTTHATISKRCKWSASVSLTDRGKVPGRGKLGIIPSFGGNKVLAALTGKPLTVHYR